MHVVTSFSCIPVISPKLVFFLAPLQNEGGWSLPRPGRFTPRKDAVPTGRGRGPAAYAGWTTSGPGCFTPLERPSTHCTGGRVGLRAGLERCGKSRPAWIRSPDSPTRSQSLYRLSYPAHDVWKRTHDNGKHRRSSKRQ